MTEMTTTAAQTVTRFAPDDAAGLISNAELTLEALRLIQSTGTPVPTHTNSQYGTLRWLYFNGDHRGFATEKEAAQAVMRGLGGKWDKTPGSLFQFTRTLSTGVKLEIVVERAAVCNRVVTGVEKVVTEVPASPAVQAHTVVEEVEIVEWKCEPVMGETTLGEESA